MGPGFLFDLHVHTEHSHDAAGSVLECAQWAKRVGLHGFAVTDHNTVKGHKQIKAAAEATGMIIIPGVECSTVEGHLLCLGIAEAPKSGRPMEEIIHEVWKAGGIAIPAHPLRVLTGVGPTDLKHLTHTKRIAIAEACNGRDRPLVRRNVEDLVANLGLAATGGSDAHHPDEVGTCWTSIPGPVESVDDVIAALRDANCQAGGTYVKRMRIWKHRIGMALGRP